MELSEASEQLWDVLFVDTHPSVADVHDEAAFFFIVARLDRDLAHCRELERILNQVYYHLLESSNITDDFW